MSFFIYKASCNLEKEKSVKLKWDYLSEAKANTVMNGINDLAVVMVTEKNFLDGNFQWDSNQNRN